MRLYPVPKRVEIKEGNYAFSDILISGDICPVVYKAFSLYEIEIKEGKGNILFTKTSGLDNEEYKIIINENGAELFYSDIGGALYGTQTLCQLIREKNEKTVPYLEISDKPAIKNRHIQLDISRGKIPTMEHFKEITDYFIMARCNVLMLYFDNPVIRFPYLEDVCCDDAITLDELKEIKKICNDNNIRMMFASQSFGHFEKFLCHDKFKHLSNSLDENKPGSVLNPLDPECFEFLEKLYDDIIPFNDTDIIKIGGDEVTTLGTGKSKEIVEKKGKHTVYMEHMTKVVNLIYNKYGKKSLLPNDMFMKINDSEEEILEKLKTVPKNAAIYNWGYESEVEFMNFDKFDSYFEKMNLPFYNASSTGLFTQFVPRTYNQTRNAENSCAAAIKHNADGVVQTIWGDGGNPQFFVMELGGIFTYGATAWNVDEFQLSDVISYMDKYIYKSENDSVADCISEIGDAAWFAKLRTPNSTGFPFADSGNFENPVLWNGYHAHGGLDKICVWDAIDIYGCEKAIKHINSSKERIKALKFNCKNADLIKEKILLNVMMYECSLKSSYMKLLVFKLNNTSKALELKEEVLKMYDIISEKYERLWLTDNRHYGKDIYMNTLKRKKDSLLKLKNN